MFFFLTFSAGHFFIHFIEIYIATKHVFQLQKCGPVIHPVREIEIPDQQAISAVWPIGAHHLVADIYMLL